MAPSTFLHSSTSRHPTHGNNHNTQRTRLLLYYDRTRRSNEISRLHRHHLTSTCHNVPEPTGRAKPCKDEAGLCRFEYREVSTDSLAQWFDTVSDSIAPLAMLSSQSMGAGLQVAPLALGKAVDDSFTYPPSQPQTTKYYEPRRTADDLANATANYHLSSEMTPPATPNGSQEDLAYEPHGLPLFHNFLRAFYPFSPTYAMSDSSITLPLNEGDVILVHSIHTNGWADGTLLASGARGWLPTNYCEAYEPDEMRSLLNALLNFWDLLRSSSVNDAELFGNQEFMKGIIAGVRFLLVRCFPPLYRAKSGCCCILT